MIYLPVFREMNQPNLPLATVRRLTLRQYVDSSVRRRGLQILRIAVSRDRAALRFHGDDVLGTKARFHALE
jgi:hypothetical protein